MTLFEQINNDIKLAMKAKDQAKLSTLRMLKSALKNFQIEVQHELSDEEVGSIVKSQIKQLKDSLASFEEAGRQDLADSAKIEVDFLDAYMPEQLGDDELEGLVKEALDEVGAESKADMGKAMGAAMKKVAGGADGTRVKAIVEKLLAIVVLAVAVSVLDAPVVHAAAEASASADVFVMTALRIGRILLIIFGIVFINLILTGGFAYMIASGRDDVHSQALGKITTGLLGSILMVGLFTIATVALQNLS